MRLARMRPLTLFGLGLTPTRAIRCGLKILSRVWMFMGPSILADGGRVFKAAPGDRPWPRRPLLPDGSPGSGQAKAPVGGGPRGLGDAADLAGPCRHASEIDPEV